MEIDYSELATTDYGNILKREQFIDISVAPLWQGIGEISVPAFTVQLSAGDNLMLHSAIYKAPKGSIIVVDGVDDQYAVAGGNVCKIAKSRGIKAFVIDGVIRDLHEITQMGFPVYAKGVFPVPGKKEQYSELGMPIMCGGVRVCTGDIIVADIEGVAVIPQLDAAFVYAAAKEKEASEAAMTLSEWTKNHKTKIKQAVDRAKQ